MKAEHVLINICERLIPSLHIIFFPHGPLLRFDQSVLLLSKIAAAEILSYNLRSYHDLLRVEATSLTY